MVSPTALLPQRRPRPGWPRWALSPVHGAPQHCLLPLPFSSPLAPKGRWQGTPATLGQMHAGKGSIQPLQEPGLCGHGVAQVLVTSELL